MTTTTVRLELNIEVDMTQGDPLNQAMEILYSAPAFDTAEDIKEQLEPVVDGQIRIIERMPEHDGPGKFAQTWVFEIYGNQAYFDHLEQDSYYDETGETYHSADVPDWIIDEVEEMGYNYNEDV